VNRQEASELKVFQGPLALKIGESFHLRFGPMDFYVEKLESEVKVRWMTSNDWMDSSFHYEHPFTGAFPSNLLTEKRFAFSGHAPELWVAPCLGELPFVVRPDTTFIILPGEKIKIFLSTPMNLRLQQAQSKEIIDEFPILHRVKTWFGDSPTTGQLCFFTRIHAALFEEKLPFRPHRALTQLMVENSTNHPIPIEKLKIPVNHLNLYQDERGLFVTSSLSVRISAQGQLKDLRLSPPEELGGPLYLVQPPRDKVTQRLFKSITEIMR
jgi:hypothetical protein